MYTILFVDDDLDILQFYSEALADELKAKIIPVSSGREAIDCLKSVHVDLIVCDFNMPDLKGDAVYLFVRQNLPHVPYILFSTINLLEHKTLSDLYLSHPGNAQLIKPIDIQEMILTISQSLAISYEGKAFTEYVQFPQQLSSQYVAIPLNIFLRFNTSPVDVFTSEMENFYQPILSKGQRSIDKVYKLLQSHIDLIYIPSHQIPTFIKSLEQITINYFNVHKNIFDANELVENHKIIHTCFSALEIHQESLIVTQKLISATFDTIKQDKKLTTLISKLSITKNYIFDQSIILSYLSHLILNGSEWDTHFNREALTGASLLHDILLPNQYLAQIKEMESTEFKNLSEESQKIIKTHPTNIAQILLNSLQVLPSDTIRIVWQHHERPDGSGFPKGIKESDFINLSRLFVILLDVSDMIIKNDMKMPPFKIFKDYLNQQYSQYSTFKYPLGLTLKFLQGENTNS